MRGSLDCALRASLGMTAIQFGTNPPKRSLDGAPDSFFPKANATQRQLSGHGGPFIPPHYNRLKRKHEFHTPITMHWLRCAYRCRLGGQRLSLPGLPRAV